MLGQATDRICGAVFSEDLVPWTQQEFSKVHAKAVAVGNPTWEGRGGDRASKTTALGDLTLALITCSE